MHFPAVRFLVKTAENHVCFLRQTRSKNVLSYFMIAVTML
jgi:hypothetical protein